MSAHIDDSRHFGFQVLCPFLSSDSLTLDIIKPPLSRSRPRRSFAARVTLFGFASTGPPAVQMHRQGPAFDLCHDPFEGGYSRR